MHCSKTVISFDHVVRELLKLQRHLKTERIGGLEVDDDLIGADETGVAGDILVTAKARSSTAVLREEDISHIDFVNIIKFPKT